ncbi:MAG: Inner rane component of tripartite multidrug resistance system [Chthonomonadaceae bacterium]|nr:Inner rane component of tripartite multidrug resistance system [Chthonomonadaceae bacterium]
MATTVQARGAEHAEVDPYRWFILLGLITVAVMEVLDTTIVNVALPQMAGNLGATFQEVAWVSTGYILSNVVVLPMTAFLTTTFGRRNYLGASIIIFVVASFLCGTSHSLIELVLWRVMQGAGGAALLSTAQATLRQVFPREQQGIVQAIFLLGIIVAPTLGPTLGGWITDNYTWNWCFFINVPIGILSFFLVTTFLHDPPEMRQNAGRVDFLGIGLLAVGLSCLQYVLEEGQTNDWFNDPLITRLAIISGVALSIMLWWELSPRNTAPVVDLRVLRNRDLASGLFLFVSLGFGLYGGTYLFPLFAQALLGFSPTTTGLMLLPGGIATGISVLICGRLLNGPKALVDPRVLILFGCVVFSLSMWTLGHLTTAAGEPDVRMALLLRGFGLGFLFTPINNAVFGNIDPRIAQQASGLINLARQLGGSFGIAILGTYLTNQTQFHRVHLLQYIYPDNPAVVQRLQMFKAAFMAQGMSADVAQQAALKVIDGTVMRQASILAYNNSWMFILIAFACTTPAILLLRKPRGAAVAVEAH